MSRRYTSRDEDQAFLLSRLRDIQRAWQVGDACRSYDGQSETTVAGIDGDIVTLANGDRCHITKLRSAL